MDFNKLIEPYTENRRSVEGQIRWLEKTGLSQGAIDYAMTNVYKRLENGEKFADGRALDLEIKRIGLEYHSKDSEEQFKKRIGEVEKNLDADWNNRGRINKIWQVITGKA